MLALAIKFEWQYSLYQALKQSLIVGMGLLQVGRNLAEHKLYQAVVQEWRSHLQRVQYAGSVHLRQNVLRQLVGAVHAYRALQQFGRDWYTTLQYGFGN